MLVGTNLAPGRLPALRIALRGDLTMGQGTEAWPETGRTSQAETGVIGEGSVPGHILLQAG